MQADLEAAGAGVVPGLVVKLRMAVVELDQPAPTAACLESAQRLWQSGFQSLPQPCEEFGRRQHCPACQLAEYIS
jgi:hypothetical protein